MKFLWTTIHVKDMDASLKFYQDIVGLELRRRFNSGPSMELAFLGTGETEIELICAEHDIHPGNIVGISIGFSIENADDFRKILVDMGLVVSDMIKPNPMMQFFYVKDADGVNVQFVHHLS